jgi:hypothetical protein
MGNLKVAPLGQPLALLSNVTLSWKGLPWTRTFMLFGPFVSYKDFFSEYGLWAGLCKTSYELLMITIWVQGPTTRASRPFHHKLIG